MIFYYIRHGDPVYEPDSLTPLGERQAEAVAKRLSVYGLDKIYVSTSQRAILTAKPTCEILKMEAEAVDFANEKYAYEDFSIERVKGDRRWAMHDDLCMDLFLSDSFVRYNPKWYDHPKLKEYGFGKGVDRVYRDTDEFFKNLGFEHIRGTGRYKVTNPKYSRVALFAHHGFGMAFLSALLDVPYPFMVTHTDMTHSGVTVIHFVEKDGFAIPKMLMFSSDAHIYNEGYGTKYINLTNI